MSAVTSAHVALLVDDDFAGAELTGAILKRVDPRLEVAIVHDGEEALDYLRCGGSYTARATGQPAVVFLDLNMPRLDGHEVLRQIRADTGLRAIRVIILTSSDRPADMTHSTELGADAHVIKPVSVTDLIARLRAVAHLWTESAPQ